MSLKIKTAIILFCILGLFSLLNVAIQQKVIYPSFVELEMSEAETNISRVSGAIKNELNHLDLFCKDWALWTDTYDFIKELDQEYIDENLMLNTFEDNSLFHISYHLNDGTVIFTKSYDIELKLEEENSRINEIIPLLIKRINISSGPIPDRAILGILNSKTAPLIITVQPVMTSERTSDSPGVMVMAKYINSDMIESIAEQVEVDFTLKMVSNIPFEADDKISIIDEKDGTYLVSQSVPTVKGGEALVLSTTYPRTISQRGNRSILTAQIIMLIAMLVLMVVIHRLISRVVIKPIERVTVAARKIRSDGDYNRTITQHSSDEIGSMIGELNGMVETIRDQTEELNALARVDGLTGLYNRRTLDELLEVEWLRMHREKTHLSVLQIDIDNFKKYNDHFGHLKGDTTLKLVAGVLGKTIKLSSDAATRYGGEEFCIILPNTDSSGAATVAERICKEVRELYIKQSELLPTPFVTVSIGTATATSDDTTTATDLVERADNALYKAKDGGRNCWKSAE
jgi:diguanylate cyclase (GGDEF)-like protein